SASSSDAAWPTRNLRRAERFGEAVTVLLLKQAQYFGTDGSTLSLQARIPPFMFFTLRNPACFRKSTALALRMPLLQWATISSAELSSFTRLGNSPSGISLA